MLRMLLTAASVTGVLAGPILAQHPAGHAPRAQLDYFVSRYEAPAGPPVDGLGGRLLWPLRAAGLPVHALRAGVFAAHTPRDEGLESWRVGAHADAGVVHVPGWAPLEGMLTLSAGVVRASRPAAPHLLPPDGPAVRMLRMPAPVRTERETGLSVAPGVGARLGLSGGRGVRADVRRVWDFRRTGAAATELAAGVSLPI